MLDTSARLLHLLAILSERATWTGAELVGRLEVTPRTLRRDIDRLRQLGYPVESTSGPAGGYALAAGKAVPPLSFDPDEVVAVALGLSLAGAELGARSVRSAAESAAAKVIRVLPSRLQRRLAGLRSAVHAADSGVRNPLDQVAELAKACADQRLLSFVYTRGDGGQSEREVEPYGVTLVGGRWYLVGHDRQRADWRTYRVDRIDGPVDLGGGFAARPMPSEDLGDWVRARLGAHRWPLEGRVIYALPAAALRSRVPHRYGQVDAIDERSARLVFTGSSWEAMAAWLCVLGPLETIEGPEPLRQAVAALAERLRVAAG